MNIASNAIDGKKASNSGVVVLLPNSADSQTYFRQASEPFYEIRGGWSESGLGLKGPGLNLGSH